MSVKGTSVYAHAWGKQAKANWFLSPIPGAIDANGT